MIGEQQAVRERRLLVYSDAHESAATLWIRLVEPLRECGFEPVDANYYRRRISRLPRLIEHDFDAVVVHRAIKRHCRLYDALIEAARRQSRPVIHDTDDLLVRVSRSHPDYPVYRAKAVYALKAVVDADFVVVSTQPLADYLAAFHSRIAVIANRLPASLWRNICQRSTAGIDDRQTDRVTIGYIGSDTHQPDLRLVEDALVAVLRRHEGRVRFLSVGVPLTARLKLLPNVEQCMPAKRISRRYPEFTTFAATLPIDVGIAPLVDNPFNRCKSDVKFQEYAALGIPAVCSDLAPYRDRVRHGVNGFLAADASQWEDCLNRLVSSAELRRRIRAVAAREMLRQWESAPDQTAWSWVIEQATRLVRSGEAKTERDRIGPVIEEILSYQVAIERKLKRTVEYQVGRTFARIIRKLAS